MNKWNKFLTEGELKTVGIVACLNDKQQFLVIRRSNVDDRAGQWTMPGGHIDDSDLSIEAGAIRELKEEAGLVCKISDLVYLGVPKPDKYMFMTQKWTGEVNIDKPNPKYLAANSAFLFLLAAVDTLSVLFTKSFFISWNSIDNLEYT